MSDELNSHIADGTLLAWHAARQPELPAVASQYGDRTFAELEANVNRLARGLRAAGIQPGDAVAAALKNRPEFLEVLYAAERLGARFTPINFHLTGEEIAYVLNDCEARVFAADADLAGSMEEALIRCRRCPGCAGGRRRVEGICRLPRFRG